MEPKRLPCFERFHFFRLLLSVSLRQISRVTRLVLLGVLFVSHSVEAQVQIEGAGNPVKHIDVLPPSPAVAGIGNFSKPGVGMVSGALNLNIPVISLAAHGLSIPLNVSYSSNGVKVDEIASRVGLGWNFEAGGAITRTVRGEPDETSEFLELPAYHPTNDDWLNQSVNNDMWDFIYFLRDAVYGQKTGYYDTEPDIFSFSFCGITGKFILDENETPIQITKSNLRIDLDFNSSDWNYKITDASGNEFYFGGSGRIEKSKKEQTCGKSYDLPIATAWFIKKIVLYNGQEINFSYNPINYIYDTGVSQSMYYTNEPAYIAGNACVCPGLGTNNTVTTCVSYVKTWTYYLTGITTPTQSVGLTYTPRGDCGDVKLSSIGVNYLAAENDEEVYTFYYDEYYSSSFAPPNLAIQGFGHLYRLFLKEIRKTSEGKTQPLYEFSYNEPGALPVRLSFAQDHWGYFNGKENSILIPAPGTYVLRNQFPNATANREPDTLFADKGLLTKIKYPTSGYDKVEWEPNTIHETRTIYPTQVGLFGNTAQVTGSGFKDENEIHVGTLNVGFRQMIKFHVRARNLDPSQTPTQFHIGKLIVQGLPSGGEISTDTGTERDVEYDVPAGNYEIYLRAAGEITKTECTITYIPGPGVEVTRNWPVAGMRVKSINSFNYNNVLVQPKRYAYHTLTDTLISSGVFRARGFEYMRPIQIVMFKDAPFGGGFLINERTCSFSNMFSSSNTNLFNPSGSPVSYPTVLEISGLNSSNGVIEHKFITREDTPPRLLVGSMINGATPNNGGDLGHGKEIETNYYKKENGTYTLLKRQSYRYKWPGDLIGDRFGVVVNKWYEEFMIRGDVSGVPDSMNSVTPLEWRPYDATKYRITSAAMMLDSVIEESYEGAQKLVSIQKYSYDDYISLQPTEMTSVDSKGDVEVVKNYYSSNAGSSVVLAADAPQMSLLNTLKNKNNISTLVYQTKTTNNVFTGAQRVRFHAYFGNIFPAEVKEYVAEGVEANAFYIDAYDSIGNIAQRRKRDGIIKSYIWDYNRALPVAEVTGSPVAEIAATSFESDGNGNWNLVSGTVVTDVTAPTGNKILQLGSLQKSGLNNQKTYTVSYFYKDGNVSVSGGTITDQITTTEANGWTSVRLKISNLSTLTVSGSGSVDEVRVYPSSSTMTTLTHIPGKGAISTTDSNNKTRHFEYDHFGRLKVVRNSDKHLLSTYRYNYINTTVD